MPFVDLNSLQGSTPATTGTVTTTAVDPTAALPPLPDGTPVEASESVDTLPVIDTLSPIDSPAELPVDSVAEVPVEPVAPPGTIEFDTSTSPPASDTAQVVAQDTAQAIDQTLPADPALAVEAVPVQVDTLSFSSTPDADDMDKPLEVKSPEIKVAENVEVRAAQSGLREVVGPDFGDVTAPPPVAEITGNSIMQRLANLGNILSPSASSTVQTQTAEALDPVAVSETPVVELPVVDPPVEPALPDPAPEVSVPDAPVLADVADPVMPDPLTVVEEAIDPAAATVDPVMAAVVETIDTDTPMSGIEGPGKTYNLDEMLREAITMRASDLHLTIGYRAMARVDGKLTPIKSNILDHESIKVMVAQVIKGRDAGDPEKISDYDLSYKLPDGSARFRVNVFRQQESLAMVLRLIPTQIQSIESLKLPPVIKEFTKFSSGLVLFTGPTGSGKSTTIAALLNEININEPVHIVTVEDPIEYVYPKGTALVDQREIFTDTESWGSALRSVLRQDPDVVLIGEMRDLETISAAIRVAETGHLVFATLHTNSAAQSIDRIIDVFPEGQQTQVRTQLASVIQAIVSQRLVPITGGGRRVSTEILIATPAVRNAIRDDKVYQIDNMIQTSAELGMISMEKSLVSLVREGLISTEQAQGYSNKPADVLTLLGQNR